VGLRDLIYGAYERQVMSQIPEGRRPRHVGVILDGNRRWAKANPSHDGDISSARGHKIGAAKIIDLLDWCDETQVKVVTLWLLSNQNLHRPADELAPLLEIIGDTVDALAATGRWEIRPVGSLELLPQSLRDRLSEVSTKTLGIKGVLVNVAVGYGGRSEIADAVKAMISEQSKLGKSAEDIANSVSVDEIGRYLYTAGLPDPDLVIRTSGEQRLGGFLLWQSAHSEFYFCEAYWPDFRRMDFLRALRAYSQRHRRFGV
jgi:short-chain Z-isoprenyl diphosphate synthase